ncbi:MAG: hypothetical protein PSV13_16080 [Lacunisphaera sp.]|nr:hypothetical protein [Lacunisphaera sp.]
MRAAIMFEISFYLTGALCVGLIIALVQIYKSVNRVETQNEALLAKVANLEQKLKEHTEKDNISLGALRECYDNEVERQKQKIEGFHVGRIERLKTLIQAYEDSNNAGNVMENFDEVDPEGTKK